jgi:hypothetical protein
VSVRHTVQCLLVQHQGKRRRRAGEQSLGFISVEEISHHAFRRKVVLQVADPEATAARIDCAVEDGEVQLCQQRALRRLRTVRYQAVRRAGAHFDFIG